MWASTQRSVRGSSLTGRAVWASRPSAKEVGVALGDRRPVVGDDLLRGTVRGDHHVEVEVGVAQVAGEGVAEPVPLAVGQVRHQPKQRGVGDDQPAPKLLLTQTGKLLQYAGPGKGQKRQCRIEFATVVARHGLAL